MKLYFILFNLMVFLLCAALVFLHVRHEPPAPDAALAQTPEKATSAKRSGLFYWNAPRVPDSAKLVMRNIFHPDRGRMEASPSPSPAPSVNESEKKRIELVGVCKINDFKAAIIIDKTKRALKQKHHYQLGDKLGNGYEIVAIEFDNVTLESDAGSFTLSLDHGDAGSDSRTRSLPPIQKVTVSPRRLRRPPKNQTPKPSEMTGKANPPAKPEEPPPQ